ncbi:transcription factor jun-D-like [Ananas comosus]|uniref:Transcription factor jun-D-like n=1 Tax=Ananas comosus TaxID=4615 RepID=A0A6P5HGH6_ANACO|nr:transcription factor jun-D-like [Ananas comosus]
MATKADEAPPPLPSVVAAAGAAEPSDPLCDPEIRASAAEAEEEEEDDAEEETREPKRRRTCPAALETLLPSAAACGGDGSVSGGGGGYEGEAISFSFEARSFAPIETTPKFGSFNSSSAAAPILETAPPPPPPPPPPPREEEEEEAVDGVGVEGKEERGGAEGKIGNSQGKEE